ncbi:unnamed protein product, partial [Closterium sp. Naga37s-1]
LIRSRCHCGKKEDVCRCGQHEFSCAARCGSRLACGIHSCDATCHPGSCPPCDREGTFSCRCGQRGRPQQAPLPQWEPVLPTLSSPNSSPAIRSISALPSGVSLPCHQEYLCDRRCQRGRPCGRHLCKRRCCAGDCPPCPEVCGRKLRCGNHKCPAPCHSGPCAPCPVTVRIACFCGTTAFSVPCGAEKQQRPPRCHMRCPVPPTCHHGDSCRPHRCHYGACPPCSLPCSEPFDCGHSCPLRCHGPRPPPNPPFSLEPPKKKKKGKKEGEEEEGQGKHGSPCPPCVVPVVRECRGRHQGQECELPCSHDPAFSCELPCGNPLACGNHACQLACHVITRPRTADGQRVLVAGEGDEGGEEEEEEGGVREVEEGGEEGRNLLRDTCYPCKRACQKVGSLCCKLREGGEGGMSFFA